VTIPGVILAGGASTRLGRPKQLVDFNGRPLVVHAITVVRDAGCAPIILVTGAHADAVLEELRPSAINDVDIVHNSDWRDGQGTSVARAAQRMRDFGVAKTGVLYTTTDQPHVRASHLRTLREAIQHDTADIAATAYDDDGAGVPACFHISFLDELMRCDGDVGAKHIIGRTRNAGRHRVMRVTCDGAACDVDVPADLERLHRSSAAQGDGVR